MPFEKGGKPGPGKPKGTKHKKTLEWEALGDYVCNEGVERYMQILKKLPDDQYMERFEHVLEYFKPRLTRISLPIEPKPPLISKKHQEEMNKAIDQMLGISN